MTMLHQIRWQPSPWSPLPGAHLSMDAFLSRWERDFPVEMRKSGVLPGQVCYCP